MEIGMANEYKYLGTTFTLSLLGAHFNKTVAMRYGIEQYVATAKINFK